MKKVLLGLLVLLMVLAGIGAYTLQNFGKIIGPKISAQVVAKTGWAVAIDGDVSVSFSLRPTVKVTKIVLSDTKSGDSATIGAWDINIALLPLFAKKVEIKKTTLTDVDVNSQNQHFFAKFLTVSERQDKAYWKSEFSALGIDYALDGETDPIALIGAFDFKIQSKQVFSEIKGVFKDGTLDAVVKVASQTAPIAIAPNLSLTAKIAGKVEQLQIPEFVLMLNGNNKTLLKAQGSISSFQPLSADAKVSGSITQIVKTEVGYNADVALKDKTIQISNLTTKGEGLVISSGSVYAEIGKIPVLNAKINAPLLNLEKLLPQEKVEFVSVKDQIPATVVNTTQPSSAVQKSDKLDLEVFRAANAQIVVDISNFVGANNQSLGRVELNGTLKNGVLSVPSFKLASYLTANVIADAQDSKNLKAKITAKIDALPLPLFLKSNGVTKGALSGQINLSTIGNTMVGLMGALNGKVLLMAKDVAVQPSNSAGVPEFMTSVVSDLNKPFVIKCGVVNVPFVNGIMTSAKSIAVETDLLNAQLNGTANFKTQTLNMNLLMAPQKNNVVSALLSDMTIQGAMSDPVIALNADAGIQKALNYGFAFLQGGKKAARQVIQNENKLTGICQTAVSAQ